MSAALQELKARLGRLSDLDSAAALASWDQQTKMPPRGGAARASMLATLAEVAHREFTDPEVARLLDRADAEVSDSAAGQDPDSDEIRLLAVVRRRHQKATRVPSSLAAELARASSTGQEAWVEARERSDFTAFEPHLRKGVELTRRYIDYQLGDGGFDCAYDVLLDDYAPGMRTAHVSDLFDELSAELLPMLAAIAQAPAVDDWPLRARFPERGQRSFVGEVLGMMGFDHAGWRLDDTVHPFAMEVGEGDVRLTTRFDEGFWPDALYSAMHECGHGLYEAGIPASYRRGPLGSIDSLAQHESQSRLWENMVGRGRPFCEILAPRMAALAGPTMEGLTPESLYRAVNRVEPSLIRVDADEATYALHIILRFELEQQLIDGTLDPRDAAEAWRARFSQLLGIEVDDDADGVLQDVHWAAGIFGYFPTYTLGNLIAAQLWERAGEQLPGLDAELAAGRLGGLRDWLELRVHRFGAKYPTTELLEREAGGPMTVAPFVRYLKTKLGDVYGLDLNETQSRTSHMKERLQNHE
jgi:carboxypeptidase Taq